MNREILFKAKRKDNGEWVQGYYLNIAKINHFICTGKIKLDGALKGVIAPEMHEVAPDTICQYTGLVDKNGKKVWENDIVCVTHEKYKDCDEMETYQLLPEIESYKRNYSVEFVNSGSRYGCRVRNKSIHFMLTRNVIFNHKVEVIGNIFDDKELLEVE